MKCLGSVKAIENGHGITVLTESEISCCPHRKWSRHI